MASNILLEAINASVRRQEAKGKATFKEIVNTNSISIVLNTKAIAILKESDLASAFGKDNKMKSLSLRADTRAQANAIEQALKALNIVAA